MRSPDDVARLVLERCAELAQITDEPGCVTRGFLSPAMDEAMNLVARWMSDAGLKPELDSAGNLIGTLSSGHPDAQVFLIGSHLDTVRNAGQFDGILGVLLAIELASQLEPGALTFDLEIIAFSDEEGLRFGAPFLGSRALLGCLPEKALDLRDCDEITLQDAICRWNAKNSGETQRMSPPEVLADLKRDRYDQRELLGYLEAHIEQGPWLEERGLSIGVLEALACSCWLRVRFIGQAGHAGTTPMNMRRDAMPAAAQVVLEAERLASGEKDLVATVGRLQALPGAGNVIPGQVELYLDMRHPARETLEDAVESMIDFCRRVAGERELELRFETLNRQDGAAADPRFCQWLGEAARAAQIQTDSLVVGAGHDALIMAQRMPMAMLLLRSPGGISHHPDEAVSPEDIADAFQVMVGFLQRLAHHHAPEYEESAYDDAEGKPLSDLLQAQIHLAADALTPEIE